MKYARIKRCGDIQINYPPDDSKLDVERAGVSHNGHDVILRPPSKNAAVIFDVLCQLSVDHIADEREHESPQSRDYFD